MSKATTAASISAVGFRQRHQYRPVPSTSQRASTKETITARKGPSQTLILVYATTTCAAATAVAYAWTSTFRNHRGERKGETNDDEADGASKGSRRRRRRSWQKQELKSPSGKPVVDGALDRTVVAKSSRLYVSGLPNIGNSCFVNALMQALASVGTFRTYLYDLVDRYDNHGDVGLLEDDPFDSERSVIVALALCLKELEPTEIAIGNDPATRRRSTSRIFPLLKLLGRQRNNLMKWNEQQDVSELFHVLMDMIECEASRWKEQWAKHERFDGVGVLQIERVDRDDRQQDTDEDDPVVNDQALTTIERDGADVNMIRRRLDRHPRNPMRGLMATTIQCEFCKRKRPTRMTTFFDVSVTLPPDDAASSSLFETRPTVSIFPSLDESDVFDLAPPPTSSSGGIGYRHTSLQDCLKQLTRAETIAAVECSRCQLQEDLNRMVRDGGGSHERVAAIEKELSRLKIASELRRGDESGRRQPKTRCREEADPRKPPALRRDVLSRPPVVLCVHLRRRVVCPRTGMYMKITRHIKFDLVLQVAPFCDPSIYPPKSQSVQPYRLVAVVAHHGSNENGHFTTYRRVRTHLREIWIHASDTETRQASVTEVLRAQAYMLFYEKFG